MLKCISIYLGFAADSILKSLNKGLKLVKLEFYPNFQTIQTFIFGTARAAYRHFSRQRCHVLNQNWNYFEPYFKFNYYLIECLTAN